LCFLTIIIMINPVKTQQFILLFSYGSTAPFRVPRCLRGFMITHIRHATFGRTPLDEGPARRRDLYLTTHNTHKRQTSMPLVGFFFFCDSLMCPLRMATWLPKRIVLWLDSLIWALASSFRRGFMVTHIWDTPQSVGLLWTRDKLVAETSTWQHTTLTRDRHPCPRWDSNPWS
jgi:hypothetical protein